MRDDTILCRCEEVTYGEVRAALESGLTDAGDIRRYTRAGMGFCQGKTCERLLLALIRSYCAEHGLPVPENDIRPRPPLAALPAGAIADCVDTE